MTAYRWEAVVEYFVTLLPGHNVPMPCGSAVSFCSHATLPRCSLCQESELDPNRRHADPPAGTHIMEASQGGKYQLTAKQNCLSFVNNPCGQVPNEVVRLNACDILMAAYPLDITSLSSIQV